MNGKQQQVEITDKNGHGIDGVWHKTGAIVSVSPEIGAHLVGKKVAKAVVAAETKTPTQGSK